MLAFALLVCVAIAQDGAPSQVEPHHLGDFWAALAGGGGGAVSALSAAYLALKRVLASMVEERTAGLQARLDEQAARIKELEGAPVQVSENAAFVALAQKVEAQHNTVSGLDVATDQASKTLAAHGVLLDRLRSDHDEHQRADRHAHQSIRDELAGRLDRLADRLAAAAAR